MDYFRPSVRARALPAGGPAHGARRARRGGVHQGLRRHDGDPLLPALLPRRGDPDPRLQRAHASRPTTPRRRPRSAGTSSCSSTPSTTSTSSARCACCCSSTRAQAYAPGQGLYWKTMSTSTGVEARFTMPVLNVPFRLIYAWNPNRDFYQPPTRSSSRSARRSEPARRHPHEDRFRRCARSPPPCSRPAARRRRPPTLRGDPHLQPGSRGRRAASSGVQYKVTNADDSVSYYDYDYRTHFTVHIQETPARRSTSPRSTSRSSRRRAGS